MKRLSSLEFFERLKWIDGRPLVIEPYRQRLFTDALDTFDEDGRPRSNLVVSGRAKKNFKTSDLILAELYGVLTDSPYGNECYLLGNDRDQAGDDLALLKKLVKVNPVLGEWLRVKSNIVERRDGAGFIEVLAAGDAVGAHGKTYRMCGFDEIHGYRNWDLLEALALDPTRPDQQQWITSYASMFHKPGAPLFDMLKIGREGRDPRMLLSWYAADFCTDPALADASPEDRANPSRASWADPNYLKQQAARLPAHKFRRLHLNLPGLPEGSAYQPEPVIDAIERGVQVRAPEPGIPYVAGIDMSGGSSDDAVLSIGHVDPDGLIIQDCIVNQGQRPPFDPLSAVERFARVMDTYGVSRAVADSYAGRTFVSAFEREGITLHVERRSASQLYESMEPSLNGRQLRLLDVGTLEQQLLGLIWRGGKITHHDGEHDDFATATATMVRAMTRSDLLPLTFYNLDAMPATVSVDEQQAEHEAEYAARLEQAARVVTAAIASRGVYFPGDQ